MLCVFSVLDIRDSRELRYRLPEAPVTAARQVEDSRLHKILSVIGGDTIFRPTRYASNLLSTPEQVKAFCLRHNLEGLVAKHHPHRDWLKIKPTHTCDLLVKDVVEGKGRLKGTLGTFICQFWDDDKFTVRVGGGMDDGDRHEFWLSPPEIIEVEYQAVQKNSLQFPRFVRVRDDEKRADECTIDQLKGVRKA